MPEVKITRQEVVVVDTVSHNEYGDLLFTDKAGKEYKVGNKRTKYFEEVIIPDKAVQLNFSTAYNKEYIYSAKLVDLPPEEEPAQFAKPEPIVTQKVTVQKSAPVTVEDLTGTPKVDEKIPGQQIGMTTKEIGDMIRAGKMKSIFGVEAAVELTKWYRSQILGTTRVNFDGAKLPKFTSENT